MKQGTCLSKTSENPMTPSGLIKQLVGFGMTDLTVTESWLPVEAALQEFLAFSARAS